MRLPEEVKQEETEEEPVEIILPVLLTEKLRCDEPLVDAEDVMETVWLGVADADGTGGIEGGVGIDDRDDMTVDDRVDVSVIFWGITKGINKRNSVTHIGASTKKVVTSTARIRLEFGD